LSKNKIAWLGFTAKRQKATLNIFTVQSWFLVSSRRTPLGTPQVSITQALLKKS